jgi:transcriptional regulator with XRE-family HTH domain
MTDDRGELASLLRAWRTRLRPADVGMPAGANRRIDGLRRQELAVLSGLSVDYLDRLEQGRATSPSADVLEALARALRLSAAEHEHLFRAAGRVAGTSGMVPRRVPSGVVRMVDRWTDLPAGVFTAAWSLTHWNHAWAALFGDPPDQARNLARAQFTAALPGIVFTAAEQERFEAALTSDLRIAAARYPADPELVALVADLLEHSPRFAALWAAGTVTEHAADTKLLRHPAAGELRLDCDVLTVPAGDLHVVVYSATPGTPDADRLRQAITVGAAN